MACFWRRVAGWFDGPPPGPVEIRILPRGEMLGGRVVAVAGALRTTICLTCGRVILPDTAIQITWPDQRRARCRVCYCVAHGRGGFRVTALRV